ncbi:MAG: tRNA (adenosine(37)-N6)-threonylcarbamoyltransferase complex transferase subunit TsaD [Rickettsiales bacterium]|nr:tRNA (adenosine(37)-N6)-threonylcarbamoyltransferase complex transferase subunit TsaD [Rickettsiales bacterium]
MRVLGIETSCDETAAAVVTDARAIESNVVFSQLQAHAEYGGVVPEIAARAHLDAIDTVVQQALEDAKAQWNAIDAIAVTAGPGLIGGVIVGVMVAKTLAALHQKPLVAVNHLAGHALTARLTDDVAFPYLLLLVSGGHCQILLVEDVGRYQLLGATIDDALGEAFDKTAKMLNLGYPGGPMIERLAKLGDAHAYDFPKPMAGKPGADFSFSGLKTAIRYAILEKAEAVGTLSDKDKADVAASFQRVALEVLTDRLQNAIAMAHELRPDVNALVVAGGVAANQYLKQGLQYVAEQGGLLLVVPPPKLCTDNAAMIAWAGLEKFRKGEVDGLQVEPRARWPLVA